jgi:membrane protein YdbS with pleckstrin-like domain
VSERALDPQVRLLWVGNSFVTAGFIGAIVGAGSTILLDWPAWYGFVAFLLLSLLGVLFAVLRYRIWKYEIREDAVYIERGVLTRIRTIIPHVRIQHVDTQRGPLERVLGLSRVVVYTAGSREADIAIPGLHPDQATHLQNRLRDLAIESEGDDAV